MPQMNELQSSSTKIRAFALAGVAILCALGGCSGSRIPPTAMADPCVMRGDAEGLISDADLAWSSRYAPGYLQARDAIVRNPNYSSALRVIDETRADRPGEQWVMTAYASPGNSDYGIVYVQFSSAGCDVAFVQAHSGTRVDFEVERGIGRLRACERPLYLRDPLRAIDGTSLDERGASWHFSYRFMIWGNTNGRRCAALMRPESNQSWWLEFRDLRFVEPAT